MFRVQSLEPSPGVGVLEGNLCLKTRGCTGVERAQLPQLVRSRRAAGTAEYKVLVKRMETGSIGLSLVSLLRCYVYARMVFTSARPV